MALTVVVMSECVVYTLVYYAFTVHNALASRTGIVSAIGLYLLYSLVKLEIGPAGRADPQSESTDTNRTD